MRALFCVCDILPGAAGGHACLSLQLFYNSPSLEVPKPRTAAKVAGGELNALPIIQSGLHLQRAAQRLMN
jgi:hypothetical protein